MAWKGPLVVLTSKFSASASEILAGAIQDYGRGIIVGDATTHGKGTVQSLLDLGSQLFQIPNPPNLGALKITMQQFYRPNGDSTQKRGVVADVAMPSLTTHMDVSESDLDYPIEFDRVDAAALRSRPAGQPESVGGTECAVRRSRRSESEDFAKLLRRIEQYRQAEGPQASDAERREVLPRSAPNSTPIKKTKNSSRSRSPANVRCFAAISTTTRSSRSRSITCDCCPAPQVAEVTQGGRSRQRGDSLIRGQLPVVTDAAPCRRPLRESAERNPQTVVGQLHPCG